MSEDLQPKQNDTDQENPGEIVPENEIPESIRKKLPEGAVVRRVKKVKPKQSETVRDIRREAQSRKELAQLQRARQGLQVDESVLADEPQEDLTPKTLGQKIANFWYHHKMWTGVFCLIAVLLAFGIKGWFFPTKYDVDIVLASEFPLDATTDFVEPFTHYTEDFDGNGKQTVKINDWQILRSGKYEASNNYLNIINQFRLALAMGDYDPQLYILDEVNYDYMTEEVGIVFRDLSDLDQSGRITGDRVALSETALAEAFPQYENLMKELYICIYDTEQMKTDADGNPEDKFLGKEKFVQHYEESLSYLTHLLNGEEITLPAEE